MQKKNLEMFLDVPISSGEMYKMWLDANKQRFITGKEVWIAEFEGTRYFLADGYVSGEIVKLISGKKILKSWRTERFTEDDEDTEVEIDFEEYQRGCKIILKHYNIPCEMTNEIKEFWEDSYFKPLATYFVN